MKHIILSLLLFSGVSGAYSQGSNLSIKISSGVSLSNVKTVNEMPETFGIQAGYAGNLSLKWSFVPNLYIETQLGPTINGYYYHYEKLFNTLNYQAETSFLRIQESVKHRNINNNWLLGVGFGEKTFLNLSCGIYYSLYLNSKIIYTNTTYFDPSEYDNFGDPAFPIGLTENSDTEVDRKENISPTDWGIVGQVVLGQNLNEKLKLILSAGCFVGLKDQVLPLGFLTYSPEHYNRSYIISIGIEMKL